MFKRAALSDKDRQLLLKLILGGGALGAGLGAGTSLFNQFKTLHDDAVEDPSKDDDVLYVNVPKRDKAASLLVPGAAMAGGVLSTAAAYALVRKLSQEYKKKQLQKRLDEAQQVYVSGLSGEDEPKLAAAGDGRPMSAGELGYAGATSVPLLIALASMGLSYNALNKYFPAPQPTKDRALRPRKIVLREQEEDGTLTEDKEASFELTAQDLEDATAYLVRGAHMLVKQAGSESDLSDLIGAVQDGRYSELSQFIRDGMEETLFSVVKGAAKTPADTLTDTLTYAALSKSATIGPVAELLSAAEMVEQVPWLATQAQGLTTPQRYTLAKMAAELERSIREEESGLDVKSAAQALPAAAGQGVSIEEILALLAQMQQDNGGDTPLSDGSEGLDNPSETSAQPPTTDGALSSAPQSADILT